MKTNLRSKKKVKFYTIKKKNNNNNKMYKIYFKGRTYMCNFFKIYLFQ